MMPTIESIIYSKLLILSQMYPKILPAIIFDKCIRLLKKKLLECYFLFSSYFYEANLEIQKLKNSIAKDANKFIQIKFSQSKV